MTLETRKGCFQSSSRIRQGSDKDRGVRSRTGGPIDEHPRGSKVSALLCYHRRMRGTVLALLTAATLASAPHAQTPADPDWRAVEAETLRHFQALVQFDTSDPPGNEKPAADYLKGVLEREGLAVEIYAREPNRPNVVARIKGNGRKRPLLIMGHTDVVNVDAKKWTHPPFGAVRDGGYIYGRGTVDDKDNLTAALMVMLLLKRTNTPL